MLEQIDNIKPPYQYYEIIEEEFGESGFSIDELEEIKSYRGKVKYCEQYLKRIGSGSSRVVYQIDDKWCLKLAKNSKGIAQNSSEISIYNSDNSGLIAEISDYDNNDFWIKMQLARKLNVAKFKQITGETFNDFVSDVYQLQIGMDNNHQFNDKVTALIDDEDSLISRLYYLVTDYDIHLGDFKRMSSFGYIVNDDGSEEIIIVDYGATNNVISDYYSR